jgi:hypothetical protein
MMRDNHCLLIRYENTTNEPVESVSFLFAEVDYLTRDSEFIDNPRGTVFHSVPVFLDVVYYECNQTEELICQSYHVDMASCMDACNMG